MPTLSSYFNEEDDPRKSNVRIPRAFEHLFHEHLNAHSMAT